MMERNVKKPILILGIGNILLSDEGVGIHVIEQLGKISVPEDVELVDGGTAGADIIDIIADREKVIIVDSMQTNDSPGTIRKFTINDFDFSNSINMSLHDLGIVETILMTELLGCKPKKVILFGVKPENIGCGLSLSKTLSNKITNIAELVLKEAAGNREFTRLKEDFN